MAAIRHIDTQRLDSDERAIIKPEDFWNGDDEEHADSFMFSNTAAFKDNKIINNQMEQLQKEIELAKKEADLRIQKQRGMKEEVRRTLYGLNNKVSQTALLKPFVGLENLNKEQTDTLRLVLNHINSGEDIKRHIRATELVEKWITPEQFEELKTEHKVTIKSKKYRGRTYVVHENPYERVEVFEQWARFKPKKIMSVCGVDAETGYADGDSVLNKILAIETDEDGYLKNSNISRC